MTSERAAYRVSEVAERLGIGESSVYRLIASGELGCFRLARNTVRVGVHHLAAYLERCECPAHELTEAGPSRNDPAARSGTPTAAPAAVESGYRSALRMKARRAVRSPTSKPTLSLVRS